MWEKILYSGRVEIFQTPPPPLAPRPIHSVSPSEVWGWMRQFASPPPARSVAPKPFLHASTPAKPPSMGVCVISVPLKSPSTEYWKVCMTLLHIVVIGTTCLRLLHRCQTKRMWWDDYITIIPLLVDVAYVVLMWLKFRGGGKHTYPFLAWATPIISF